MLDFPSKTLDYIKKILTRQQKEVKRNLKEVEEDDPATTPSLAESSEPGTDSYIADSHGRIMVLKNQLKTLAEKIKTALKKMKKGNYGQCERCGKSIESSRLLAMPIATLCLSCSKKITKR